LCASMDSQFRKRTLHPLLKKPTMLRLRSVSIVGKSRMISSYIINYSQLTRIRHSKLHCEGANISWRSWVRSFRKRSQRRSSRVQKVRYLHLLITSSILHSIGTTSLVLYETIEIER